MTLFRDFTQAQAAAIGVRDEPGWFGAFTRNQAPGALPNGQRVVLSSGGEKGITPDGTRGTILGSVSSGGVPIHGCLFMYFVEWETSPRVAIAVVDRKIDPIGDKP